MCLQQAIAAMGSMLAIQHGQDILLFYGHHKVPSGGWWLYPPYASHPFHHIMFIITCITG